MLLVEGSHVVHGACFQGNHDLCLYMSSRLFQRGLSDYQTEGIRENANYVRVASQKIAL